MSSSDLKHDYEWVKDIKEGSVKKMTKEEMIVELKKGQAGQRTIAVELAKEARDPNHPEVPKVIMVTINSAVARSISRIKARVNTYLDLPINHEIVAIMEDEIADLIGSIYLSAYEIEEE